MTRTFVTENRGGITLWLLAMCVGVLGFVGLAVDINNGYRNRAMLQMVADSAAHAAATELLKGGTKANALQAGLDAASLNYESGQRKAPVTDGDVVVGFYDVASKTFTANATPHNAAEVTAGLTDADGNPLATFFLGIIGIEGLDVGARSVAAITPPPCDKNGIIARRQVTMTSNNTFGDDMCIHGQQGISVNNGTTFGNNTLFSMLDNRMEADGGMLQVPTSAADFVQANSRAGSLLPLDARDGVIRATFDARYAEIAETASVTLDTVALATEGLLQGLVLPSTDPATAGVDDLPATLVNGALRAAGFGDLVGDTADYGGSVVTAYVDPAFKAVETGTGANAWDIAADLAAGYSKFYVTCIGSATRFDFPNGIVLSDATILARDCGLKSSGAVTMFDVEIGVDDPDNDEAIFLNGQSSVVTTAGASNCGTAGSVQMYTTGGAKFTAGQAFANTELRATRDIQFTANGDGAYNVYIQTWGTFSTTAGSTFTNCPTAPPISNRPQPMVSIVAG